MHKNNLKVNSNCFLNRENFRKLEKHSSPVQSSVLIPWTTEYNPWIFQINHPTYPFILTNVFLPLGGNIPSWLV